MTFTTEHLLSKSEELLSKVFHVEMNVNERVQAAMAHSLLAIAVEMKRANDMRKDEDDYQEYLRSVGGEWYSGE